MQMRRLVQWARSLWSGKRTSSALAGIAGFQPTSTTDLVGFLPIRDALHFAGGRLEPAPAFDEVSAYVKDVTNADGFVYPPIVYRATASSLDLKRAKWTEVPKTRRQAHLHHLPPSHFLYLDQPPACGDLRSSDGAFLIHLTGYLFGYRMQFHDWWIDGRARMSSAHAVYVASQTASKFIGHAYAEWRCWPQSEQKRFTNALYMLGRGPLYEWDWESFTIYYMVFDALYRTARKLHGVPNATHAERPKEMCRHYGLVFDQNLLTKIVTLRNELFHEALWFGAMPGFDPAGETWNRVSELRRICERLIPAMLGYKNQYVASPWNTFGQHVFD